MEAEVVRKVARLSRIELREGEEEGLAEQLGSIVRYFDKLQELDTTEVAPLVHAVERTDVLAEDIVAPSLSPEQALANAPRQDGSRFLVPRVLGEEP